MRKVARLWRSDRAVGNLGDHVRGRVEDVLVGRGARGAGLGVHATLG